MERRKYQQISQTEGAEWLADNLEGSRRSGDGYIACCPAHDDQNPSLSINEDSKGKVLLHCHAGCEQQEVIDALKERGLWPVRRSSGHHIESIAESGERLFVAPRSMRSPHFRKLCGREPDDIYYYRAAGGGLLGYVCRIVVGEKKSFRPITAWRNLNGDPVWRVSDFAEPKPLFGLYDLAKRPDAPVLVVEGEKTADAAEELFPEYVVISWPGGAKAVKRADWRPLQGRNATIWPDADEPGRDAATKVAECLGAIGAASITIDQLPADLPEGWDLADKIPASIKPELVLSEAKPHREKLVDYLLSARDLARMNLPPREMIIAPFLPVNSINLVYAPRGIGKTWVALTMAKAVAQGEDWIGFQVPKRRRVLYIDGEMPLADLKQRLEAIGAGRSNRIDILASEILFQDLRPLNIHQDNDRHQITEMLFSLEGRRPALIIFDNLSALRAGVDENDNAALDGLLRWFLQLRHRGYSILLIHHAGKGGDQRGASRLEDLLDTTIKLDRLIDQQESTGASFNLAFTKTRGPGFKPAELRLTLTEDEDGILRWRYAEAQRREAADETLKAIHYGPKKDMKSRFQTQQELADALKVQKSTISKHLKSLRKRGLVGASTSPILITEQGIKRLNAVGGG